METSDFLHRLASKLLECVRIHPGGGTWDRWYLDLDSRHFVAYISLDVTYERHTGTYFRGVAEEWFEPIVNKVKDIEVYETNAIYDELPEEEWDVSYNSDQIRTFINNEIYANCF